MHFQYEAKRCWNTYVLTGNNDVIVVNRLRFKFNEKLAHTIALNHMTHQKSILANLTSFVLHFNAMNMSPIVLRAIWFECFFVFCCYSCVFNYHRLGFLIVWSNAEKFVYQNLICTANFSTFICPLNFEIQNHKSIAFGSDRIGLIEQRNCDFFKHTFKVTKLFFETF